MEMRDDSVYGAREGKRRGYQRSDISDQEARGRVISYQEAEKKGGNTEVTEVGQGEEKNKEGDGGHRGGERGSQMAEVRS
jgi:hypothetical protein